MPYLPFRILYITVVVELCVAAVIELRFATLVEYFVR